MDFKRPERCRSQRTGREDRHSKFYEISDNLAIVTHDLSHGSLFFAPYHQRRCVESPGEVIPIAREDVGKRRSNGSRVLVSREL